MVDRQHEKLQVTVKSGAVHTVGPRGVCPEVGVSPVGKYFQFLLGDAGGGRGRGLRPDPLGGEGNPVGGLSASVNP